LVDEGYTGRFRARTTVLEHGDGPQLCLGGVRRSLPPQCGGPVVAGWSWDDVMHQSVNGVRWGSYSVVGRFDGTTFTLTEPAKEFDPRGATGSGDGASSDDLDRFATRCPELAGGWRPVDVVTATQEAMERATEVAATQPGYGGMWIDQNVPADTPPEQMNDPLRLVLNVITTGDLAVMERAVRAVWGGALCVTKAVRAEADLLTVQQALNKEPGILSSSVDITQGRVDLVVIRATAQLQERLDDEHGPGVVKVRGALVPID
jgi:hypothetical protein